MKKEWLRRAEEVVMEESNLRRKIRETQGKDEKVVKAVEVLWKLWILQSYSWKTRHGLIISGTSKQEGLILISLQTLTRSVIYPFEEQLLIVTFLVTDSNRLLTQSLFFLFIKLPCNTQ